MEEIEDYEEEEIERKKKEDDTKKKLNEIEEKAVAHGSLHLSFNKSRIHI
jgi:hypothetical protein